MNWFAFVLSVCGAGFGGVLVDRLIGLYTTRRGEKLTLASLDRTQPTIDAQIAIQGFSELAEALQHDLVVLRSEVDRCKSQHNECERKTAGLQREVAKLRLRVYELERGDNGKPVEEAGNPATAGR